MISWLGFLAVF